MNVNPPPPHGLPYANPYAAPYQPVAKPYDPPAASTEGASSAPLHAALYTPNHVALATFLGTPLGGTVLMTLNEHRLGRKAAAVKTLLLGVVGTVLLLGLGMALPDNFPSAPIGIGALLVTRSIAHQRQGRVVHQHQAAGGKVASGWAAAGIGLLSMLVVFVPLVVILVLVEVVRGL